ncbi:Tyrosine-protein kinase receptor Tie-1 [Holothuria leucospilota]|uniref:Tyrosine-protein kinase receptor Tie-1 n=1 Tax=Holothuria leucospilota TaxID=206669 RepID=A0A9Q1C935_HOLLE|nr:Tyrosine-protein kinase receptor Tie-1 [Holothuria leucospilota]
MANVLLLWKFLLIGFVAAEAPVTSGPPSEFTSPYKECIEGTFGVDCLQDCHCDGLCDRFTGVCNGTCEAGWIGDSCQICQGDSFGESCGQECRCEADACNKVTGECSGQCKPQWVDSYQCLAGLPDATSSKINPNTASTISCTTQISGNSTRILTVNMSREPDQVMERSIQFVDRTGVGNTEVWRFTADDIKEGDELFCLLLDQGNIVARLGITVMEYDLLVLLSPPTVVKASASSVTTTWTAWDPDRDNGDPPVVAYIPYYKKSVSDEWIRGTVVLPGEALELEVDNLESDTVYDFGITVVREGVNGEGPRSPSVAVRTTCTGKVLFSNHE